MPLTLQALPYDLLFNISQYLETQDIYSFQLICKTLRDFIRTRSVYRNIAYELLCRSRALPLRGFQRLSDLSTQELIKSVDKAYYFERAWRARAPRPVTGNKFCHADLPSGLEDGDASNSAVSQNGSGPRDSSWYKVVTAPPYEEIDWLSPITSSYTLCATKSGKVVCWDVHRDICLAQWDPAEKWELWKCRVEFEDKTVFFTMAKIITPSYDDDRVMEFVLMSLYFPETEPVSELQSSSPPSPETTPVFSHIAKFKTTGVVMNVFLLDPPGRLLSAFVWVAPTNTIGLYTLLDWDKDEYVYIDTGIQCLLSSNWSCILYDEQIVIHSEETEAAFQHFYPISLLRKHMQRTLSDKGTPSLSGRVAPSRTLTRRFIFPPVPQHSDPHPFPAHNMHLHQLAADDNPPAPQSPGGTVSSSASSEGTELVDDLEELDAGSNALGSPNPYPFPPWYPESAHFVRQWWPTLPNVPKLSCTVVLLAAHDPDTHRTRFVLAQHYFRVPLTSTLFGSPHPRAPLTNGQTSDNTAMHDGQHPQGSTAVASHDDDETEPDDDMLRLWYVSTPFEVVCVDSADEESEDLAAVERPRPLVAVDFGHAVWIEYLDHYEIRRAQLAATPLRKCLRFVTFPAVGDTDPNRKMDGEVRTLDVPDELNLDSVETINIDQSQGAVILSVKEGKIFILQYS